VRTEAHIGGRRRMVGWIHTAGAYEYYQTDFSNQTNHDESPLQSLTTRPVPLCATFVHG